MPRTNRILIRSGTAAPTASDFSVGEPAFDKSAGKFYVKNAAGAMVEIGAGGGGSVSVVEYATTGSFPATGASATLYLATDTRRLYSWTGSVYAEVGAVSSSPTDSRWDLFLPPAPTGLTGTAGNTQVTLTWTASAVVSATPVSDYLVQYSSNSGSTWTTFADGTSSATSATVTGLTNGTPYVFRVAGVNAVGTGSYTAASASVTPAITDPYFSSVSLLLHADGTGSTFIDSSSAARTVTASGSATQSAAQSQWGGKSALFAPATSDYLQVANNAAFNFGSGDWCVEFWMRAAAQGLAPLVHQTSLGATSGWIIWNYDNVSPSNSTRKLTVMANGANFILTTPGDAYTDNTWTHIAVARSGSTVSIYSNGTRLTSGTLSGAITDASTPLRVAGIDTTSWNGTFYYSGYIDDLRITKGQSRYSGASLTVPTAAFPNA